MNTNNLNHKRVMHMAHILYRRDCDLSPISDAKPDWKRSCNEAWDIQDVRTALQKGRVKLIFVKKNGEVVCRIGTLNPDFIPGSKMPKGTKGETVNLSPNYETIAYYDLTKGGWRSFEIIGLYAARPVDDISTPVYVLCGSSIFKSPLYR